MIDGVIYSFEFYNIFLDEDNWECLFFVKGIGGKFFEEGDSGLLIFVRLMDV